MGRDTRLVWRRTWDAAGVEWINSRMVLSPGRQSRRLQGSRSQDVCFLRIGDAAIVAICGELLAHARADIPAHALVKVGDRRSNGCCRQMVQREAVERWQADVEPCDTQRD